VTLEELRKIVGKQAGDKIRVLAIREHSKASEWYTDVEFHYEGETWEGSVPTVYPRGGVHSETPEDAAEVILKAYEFQDPKNESEWKTEAGKTWEGSTSEITLPMFEKLTVSKWLCVSHLAETNNPQRRIQDIKDKGFTIATDTSRFCSICKKNTTHHIMLRLPIGALRKYETWSPDLRKKIISTLGNWDVYEDRKAGADILPDHKFPEKRWDSQTHEENPDDMKEDKIKQKFQLLSNKRNEQKREACRTCFNTGKRPSLFGLKFYYQGDENWPEDVPKIGKDAEKGCVGCGWYDMAKWREEFNKKYSV